MLANLFFCLDGAAKAWHRTLVQERTSWDVFKKAVDLFREPVGRQPAANKELATRVQTSTETYVSYIQDVLSLCQKVDSQMTESDKVDI